MENKKIAIPCFIGGALCGAVALIFSPNFWWLGILAGFAAGYISYEFCEVLKAVPRALEAAGKEGMGAIIAAKNGLLDNFAYIVFTVALTMSLTLLGWLYTSRHASAGTSMTQIICILFVFALFASAILTLVSNLLGELEANYRLKKRNTNNEEIANWNEYGYKVIDHTFSNIIMVLGKGMSMIAIFIVIRLPGVIIMGICIASYYCFRFALHLIKIIHSNYRLFCAIHGALGGAVSYYNLAAFASTPREMSILIIFGGLLGVAFGIASREIISKRVLKAIC